MAGIQGAPSPKPGSVSSPIPNQRSAVEDFFAESTPSASPELPAGGESYAPVSVEAPPPEAPGIASQALGAAGQVLDYAGGFARTGLAGAAGAAKMGYEAATGQPLSEPVAGPADVLAAAKGKAPGTAEYLRRLGVPEGGSLRIGDTKITARGAAGLAGDIATDPLTAVGKLVKEIPYLTKFLQSPSRATEAIGEAVYRSGLSKIDQKLAQRGSGALSDVLIAEGAPVGSLKKIGDKVDAISETIRGTRQGLYDRATELGVTIDTSYPLKRAEAVIEKFSKDPGLAPAMSELRGLVERYKAAGKVSIDELSAWKTNLYDSLPASAFDGFGKLKGQAKTLKAALAADFRDAIVGAGNKAEKGLGNAIDKLNEKWGILLEAQKPLAKGVGGGTGKLGTAIDGLLLGSGNGWALAGKKAAEVANTTAVKTAVGQAAMEVGRLDLMNRITRQAIAGSQRPSPEPKE